MQERPTSRQHSRERAGPPGAAPAALRPRAAAHRSAPIGGSLSTSAARPPPGRPRAPPSSGWRPARGPGTSTSVCILRRRPRRPAHPPLAAATFRAPGPKPQDGQNPGRIDREPGTRGLISACAPLQTASGRHPEASTPTSACWPFPRGVHRGEAPFVALGILPDNGRSWIERLYDPAPAAAADPVQPVSALAPAAPPQRQDNIA